MNRVLRSITRVPSKLAEWLDSFRMTCDTPAFTRWAKYLDPFTLKILAGHESLETTMKYIHLNEADSETRLRDAREKIESSARRAYFRSYLRRGRRKAYIHCFHGLLARPERL